MEGKKERDLVRPVAITVADIATSSSRPDQENLTTQYHTPGHLTSRELSERDRNAVAYSRASLHQGDTLVYINYPSNTMVFDSTGFPLLTTTPLRVHSQKLLATGSKKFKELFSEWPQAKFRRRKGFFSCLPRGIKYILDLTPPDEGDEAVELISELSCSLGIRHWYSAEQRCKVSSEVCGGKDEVAKLITHKSKPVYEDLVDAIDTDFREENTAINNATNHVKDNETENSPISSPSATGGVDWKQREVQELQEVLERSKDQCSDPIPSKRKDRYESVDEIPEYCPIRHRAGIERLLQLIEGKEPRLDSAPKVWTLFVLAKYFDCRAVVVDFIVSWVLREPNCQFIEILPEATLRMGLGLKCTVLTRPAFAILVSEYALKKIFKDVGGPEPEEARVSVFGRVQEDIDEDILSAVQEAANSFMSRVEQVMNSLCNVAWFEKLPEYKKIIVFLKWAESSDIVEDELRLVKEGVAQLQSDLAHFVRGRIIWCFCTDLSSEDHCFFNSNRRAESYLRECQPDPGTSFYTPMAEKEKMITRFPWRDLRNLPFTKGALSNLLFDIHGVSEYQVERNRNTAKLNGVEQVSMFALVRHQTNFNEQIMEAIRRCGYNFGKFPAECYFQRSSWSDDSHSVDSTKVSESTRNATDLPSSQSLKPSAKSDDEEKQELIEQPASSTTSRFTFDVPLRPKFPEDAEKVLLSDKESNSNGSSSSGAERPSLPAGGKTTKATAPSLINRLSNIVSLSSNSLHTQQALVDPRVQAINMHNQNITTSSAASSPTSQPLDRMWGTPLQATATFTVPELQVPRIPDDNSIQKESPFFSLQIFFDQVQTELRRVASMMLNNGDELDFIGLTDTLLCMSDEEWKYLPLWAGGNDDGSGGVFAPMIPPASAGAGPSGPGPSFHTGYSIASRDGTESDFDGLSTIYESVGTSVAVEDGHTDHLDRRRVVSEDENDFRSEAWSDDIEEYVGKGKGKAAMHTNASESTNASQSTDEPERSITPKPETSVEDEDEWDGSDEEEAFDFGEETNNNEEDNAIMF